MVVEFNSFWIEGYASIRLLVALAPELILPM